MFCKKQLRCVALAMMMTCMARAAEPSGAPYDWTITGKPERPWLIPYHQTLVMKFFLCVKNPGGGPKKVFMTFEQALDNIRKLDAITLGMPKVVYLVGWQFDGHDSKYPAWSEVNAALKRDQDEQAVDSLRWLIREARSFNTTVSLHINMIDAYEDSPLWDTYVEQDIVYKNPEGEVMFLTQWGGQRCTAISYTREWELGLAQQRIDSLLAMIPELVEGGTIHIDNFSTTHARCPEGSPLLGYGPEKEAETQRKIFRYWRDRGIDVTSEYVRQFRTESFAGLQPMAWLYRTKMLKEKWGLEFPPEIYCGTPMSAEMTLRNAPDPWPELTRKFCRDVVSWHYENNTTDPKGDQPVREGQDLFVPALWCRTPTVVAYSPEGYQGKTWTLPPGWENVAMADLSTISPEGLVVSGTMEVRQGAVTLSVAAGQGVVLRPAGKPEPHSEEEWIH